MKTYAFKVARTDTGLSAHCTEPDTHVATTGSTLDDVRRNAAEAMSLLLDEAVQYDEILLTSADPVITDRLRLEDTSA